MAENKTADNVTCDTYSLSALQNYNMYFSRVWIKATMIIANRYWTVTMYEAVF